MPATPPAAPPPVGGAAPPSTPPPASAQPAPGTPAAGPPRPEDDPNLAMSQLVSRSRARHAKDDAEGTDSGPKPPEKPDKPPAGAPPSGTPPATPEPQNLAKLLGTAIKYGSKGPPKPPVTPGTPPPAAPPAPAAAPSAAPTTPPAPEPAKKPAKGKKTPPVDAAAIAREAATAATEAAMRTMRPAEPALADDRAFLADMADEDRRDYEIAEHLAKIDPRYANAPAIVKGLVQQAEDYAARWENANPGKTFNPSDEEHDEFYATQARPWSEAEFDDARVDMLAEKKAQQRDAQHKEAMASTQADVAHMELAPTVSKHFNDATLDIAKLVGDDVHQALTTGGWDALHQKDPIQSRVLAATLQELHPFVEAAIELDDPRGRIRNDPKNPAHAQWNMVVNAGESRLTGVRLEDGRLFARREDYAKMTPAQQRQHWYLDTSMIIRGALDYAAEQVKTITESQRELLKQMGFVRQDTPPSSNGQPTRAPAPTPAPATSPPPAPAPSVDKPASPTVGGGAKIDDTGAGPKSKEGQLIQLISGQAFKR